MLETIMFEHALWIHFAVAIGIGLLIGTERERDQQATFVHSSVGVRSFAIATLLGAVAGMIHFWLLMAVMVCVLVFAAIGYAKYATAHPGITTELSLIFSVLLGGLSMFMPEMAAAIAIVLVILLSAKETIHGFVMHILTRQELSNLLVLAAATLIILPLVPNTFIGPYHAINPRSLWLIVILVMLVGELSHIVIRWLGPRHGLPLLGLFSGFISSVATITAMAAHAKESPTLMQGAIAGAVWSSLATILQLAILLLVTDVATLHAMTLPLLFGGASIAVFGVWTNKKALKQPLAETVVIPHQFRLLSALWLAALIAAVLIVPAAVKASLGQAGLVTVSALAGFADVHAPTIAVASLVATGKLSTQQAVIAILLAFSSNAVTKTIVAITVANKVFAQPVILALMLQVLAVWLGWWLSLQASIL